MTPHFSYWHDTLLIISDCHWLVNLICALLEKDESFVNKKNRIVRIEWCDPGTLNQTGYIFFETWANCERIYPNRSKPSDSWNSLQNLYLLIILCQLLAGPDPWWLKGHHCSQECFAQQDEPREFGEARGTILKKNFCSKLQNRFSYYLYM